MRATHGKGEIKKDKLCDGNSVAVIFDSRGSRRNDPRRTQRRVRAVPIYFFFFFFPADNNQVSSTPRLVYCGPAKKSRGSENKTGYAITISRKCLCRRCVSELVVSGTRGAGGERGGGGEKRRIGDEKMLQRAGRPNDAISKLAKQSRTVVVVVVVRLYEPNTEIVEPSLSPPIICMFDRPFVRLSVVKPFHEWPPHVAKI